MTQKTPFDDFINGPDFDISQLIELDDINKIIQLSMRDEGWQKGLSGEDKELLDKLAEAIKDAYHPFYHEISEGHWRLIAKDIIARAWAARDIIDNGGFWDDNGGNFAEI